LYDRDEAVVVDTVEEIRDLFGGWDRFAGFGQTLVGFSVGMDILLEGIFPPSCKPGIPYLLVSLCSLSHNSTVTQTVCP
jgi:hypothetical protein